MSNFSFNFEPKKVKKINSKYRNINTLIPAPGTKEVFDRLERVESRSMHGQLPIIWNKASDFSVFDIADNRWIDFTSTIFVANVGHSNQKVIESIKKTCDEPLLSCYAYCNTIRADYLEKLVSFAGENFEKAFLLSAGTEATEAALKLMRMNGQRIGKRRLGIICLENNWHGRTFGAQMMSGNISQKKWMGFHDQDIHHIPFPYPWEVNNERAKEFLNESLENLIQQGLDLKKDVCGFMLETFQGWGAIFYPKNFVKEIENICKKYNIILTFDEMQSGFARTGKNFGYEHYGVRPDLICTGKGMGGGVPVSGLIGKSEIMDLPETGNMSSTHSANPLVCSAGIAVLDEIQKLNLNQEAISKGKILFEGLEHLKEIFRENITYICGKGLIAAIMFRSTKKNISDSIFTSMIVEKCYQKGLLVVHTGRESIKIGPPLTISSEALIEGIEVLKESIEDILNE